MFDLGRQHICAGDYPAVNQPGRITNMRLERISSHVFVCLFIIIFFLPPSHVFSQVDSSRRRPDVIRFADGVVFTLASPARWDGHDWLLLGGVLAGTAALTFGDEPMREFFQKQDNRFLDGVERMGYHYGKPYSVVGFTAGFYFSGLIFKNEWARETGLMMGSSIFTSSMVMGIIKNSVGRSRPGALEGHLKFSPFSNSPTNHAFPSGHSSVAFGMSILLAKRVESVPLKIFFYSVAGTTAVSRMYSDQHWLSDIAFGGIMAWFCADTAISRFQANHFKKARSYDKFVWRAYPYPGGVSLKATLR